MLSLVVALIAAASATAAPSPGDLRTVCNDGVTVSWYGSSASLTQYLEENEGATLGACPVVPVAPVMPQEGQSFLCMSHFGGFAVAFDWSQIPQELIAGWFVPSAKIGHDPGMDYVGAYELICNTDGLKCPNLTGLDGSGGNGADVQAPDVWAVTLREYGQVSPNHYAICS
jgi:hypothetical protein